MGLPGKGGGRGGGGWCGEGVVGGLEREKDEVRT